MVRGRFAPTPSGPLHFGSIVAALASCLQARAHGGEWHLRIDDLDAPRVAPGAIDAILTCLRALGFLWDGEVIYQSRRTAAYATRLRQLQQVGLAYPCGCSRKEIAAAGLQGNDGPLYPGTCRNGLAPGRRPHAYRINTSGARVRFDDGVLGLQERELERSSGDFVLYRMDGVYSFHLASAVDDAELGMTEIVRGADLLESSARQIWLIDLLSLPVPRYAHVPVAVDANGEKLSKQTHAAPVDPAHPVAPLWRALRFLGQAPPEALRSQSLTALWEWSLEHWRLERVPKVHSLPLAD